MKDVHAGFVSRWLQLAAIAMLLLCAGGAQAGFDLKDRPLAGIEREFGYFKAADGTPLAYVVYRPEGAGPLPTIAWYDVYGAGSMPPLGMVRAWVARGYAFVAASVRGTGCSDGDYVPFGAQDARDGAVFVDWAGSQAWSNGKIGLVGNSQPGIVQFGIAALHPTHLVAIAPGGTISRIYADGWYLGGIYNASFAAHWSRYDQPGASLKFAQLRAGLGDKDCEARVARIGPNSLVARVRAQPYDGEYYQRYSPYDRAPDVTVPTLMVQSWTDPAVGSSALNVFARLTAKSKRLFVLSGGHDSYLDSTAQEEVGRWMDHWLKGDDNGVDGEPRVRIDFGTTPTAAANYGDVVPVHATATQALADWPAPETKWQSWFMTAGGALQDKPANGEAAGTREYFYPAGTELPGDAVQFAMTALDWGSLRYRTPPVAHDTAIFGAPEVVLYAASEQVNTDFMVNLHDVSPSGDVTFIQRGYLRASRRAVDSSRSTAQYVFHPHLKDEPLQAGHVYRFDFSLLPVVYILRAGHSLELLLAAPSPIPSPGWGLTPLMLPGFNTVYHDSTHPSLLKIPVVPGIKAQGPEPQCGSLPFQPCRHENGSTS
ncbi:CocE/NonD family hydrolase [Solimonas terrae]|uniref:CocE/NonD family hydrolase n=1 Tax=Solimonas terrae TaxID=1396819 RepID=A0A6M2BLV9_9GAMM|nr:CocE/NonD family hydrolase [Solimonas terrae]NGY03310.1 CocE/NonD family hydrolase [Solimonas terrae]